MCNIGWEMRLKKYLEKQMWTTFHIKLQSVSGSSLKADDLFTFELEDIPKKETYTKAAKYLSDIMDIFEQDVCYNS